MLLLMDIAMRRRLRRARARAWRAIRGHYMLGLTAVALAVAGAAASGLLNVSDAQPAPRRAAAPPAPVLPAVLPPATLAPAAPQLVVTYYLVNSTEQMDGLKALEDQLIFREWLRSSTFEFLLVRSPEEEEAALKEIAAGKARAVAAQFVVEDLRR